MKMCFLLPGSESVLLVFATITMVVSSTINTANIPLYGPELVALMTSGTRVVRGKDWKWGDQDGGHGGEGKINGTIHDGWVNVIWDNGYSSKYRMGAEDMYDLNLPAQPSASRGNSKIELEEIEITCGLGDIVIISAPVVNAKDKEYYLTNPSGETKRLEIKYSNSVRRRKWNPYQSYNNNIAITHIEARNESIIAPKTPFTVFNLNHDGLRPSEQSSTFSKNEENMNANDFMLGPLDQDDHGNWVLSVYLKDINQEWMELFQVINIEIREPVPMKLKEQKLNVRDTLHLSFAYPIEHIQTCELIVPSSTFDRYYESHVRRRDKMNDCGFVVKNVTIEDDGLWKIVGVGKIVYEAEMYLNILKDMT